MAAGTGHMHLFILLLMLLVQLNCGLQFLENKILFVSLASAINIRDNLPIELDTPSIDIFAVARRTTDRNQPRTEDAGTGKANQPTQLL